MPLPIETKQLLIRLFTEKDLQDHLEYASDPKVTRFEYWEPYTMSKLTEEFRQTQNLEPGTEAHWFELAIELKTTNKVIGSVALKILSHQHRLGEVGWTLNRNYQHQGYATEAANALLRFGFEELDLFWIISFCHNQNTLSRRLMERLGMHKLKEFTKNKFAKGTWWDEVVYSITKPEWHNAFNTPEKIPPNKLSKRPT
jgi:RimJ/RimL family protein N-acetyltransferase